MISTKQRVDGVSVSETAKRVAEELGYGPGGKEGGVLLIVVDHAEGQNIFGHAGDLSPMYQALLYTVEALLEHAAKVCGGERVLSSVQKWRQRTKS